MECGTSAIANPVDIISSNVNKEQVFCFHFFEILLNACVQYSFFSAPWALKIDYLFYLLNLKYTRDSEPS